jgi:hypothetical protein
MISEEKFQQVSKELGIEVAALKAVAEVESSGEGFLPSGHPKILFEPHIFWRELVERGIDPNKYTKGNEDILYKNWKTGAYGKVSEQPARLERAAKINREAALESASWGSFQVMGNNWKDIGYKSLQDFINDAYKSEDTQFNLFITFIKSNNLIGLLRNLKFEAFALKYNGASAAANKYPQKLQAAYNKFKN